MLHVRFEIFCRRLAAIKIKFCGSRNFFREVKRINLEKKIKMAAGAGLAALALVVAGGGYYYFHVHKDAPDFTIAAISESIEKHDVKEFHRAVDLDSVLDSGYDGFIDGVTAVDGEMTPDAREAIRNFTQMLRAPMIASLKAAVDSYVATGDLNAEDNVGVMEMVERTGLNDIEVRGVKNIQLNDANREEAFADVMIYQPELGGEFPLQIVLSRGQENQWQVSRVQNFQDYVSDIVKARRAHLDEYLAKSGEINSRHDATIRDLERKYGMVLSLGNLGQDKTREELKTLVDDSIKPDWEARKQELFGLHVPKNAETLHNLYIRICDTWIAASDDYSDWLNDRNAKTIKAAEEKIHQAQSLTSQAAAIARRMTS